MIPRFAPTYTYGDLFQSRKRRRQDGAEEKLRSSIAGLYRAKHIFFFSSARVALYALLKAYGRPGGVLTPAYNCLTVPESVLFAGYSPVFADVDYASLNMTAETLKEYLSDKITVALPTHIFGIPCDVQEIIRLLHDRDILVVEDAAPAFGAEFQGRLAGSFGDAAIVSFQSIKVLSGETGGALLTNRDDLADRVAGVMGNSAPAASSFTIFLRAVARKTATRRHFYAFCHRGYRGIYREQVYKVIPPRPRMPARFLKSFSPYSSALILKQMDRLDWNLGRRRHLAKMYQDELSDIPGLALPRVPDNCAPSWIQFPVLAEDKDAFYRHMQRYHVDLTWTYRYCCAESFGLTRYPNAKKAAQTVLGLPTYPSLSDDHARYICRAAQKYEGKTL